MRSSTRRPSGGVRTNGNISCTFVRPMSSRTRRIAAHSRAKQSAKEDEGYREAPRNPSIGFSSRGSYASPPMSAAYSFDLKSLMRTMTGLG